MGAKLCGSSSKPYRIKESEYKTTDASKEAGTAADVLEKSAYSQMIAHFTGSLRNPYVYVGKDKDKDNHLCIALL